MSSKLTIACAACGAPFTAYRSQHRRFCSPACSQRRDHGGSYLPEHYLWRGLRARCLNPRNAAYHNYGGRGIAICPEWDDFAVFLADMGPRPSPEHTIDRIDNDGPYCAANCRWATRKEQTRNTRRNRLLTFEGRTQPLSAWAEELEIAPNVLANRLARDWPVEKTLATPKGKWQKR